MTRREVVSTPQLEVHSTVTMGFTWRDPESHLRTVLAPIVGALSTRQVRHLAFFWQDHRHVWGLLHRRPALLFPVRPDRLLQLCVLSAEGGETPVTGGTSRGESRFLKQHYPAEANANASARALRRVDHVCASSACRRPKESEGHTSIHQSAGY